MADGYAGAAGIAASSSAIQRSRNAAADVENVMGRRPSVTPSHLSRILYVPRHTGLTNHLPIYDMSDQYNKADVGSALIGSSLFTIRLSMMKPPREDGLEADVQYLVDFNTTVGDGGGEVISAKVQQRVLGNAGSEVDLLLQAAPEADFTIRLASNNPFRNKVPVQMSFPIPDSPTKAGISRNPYFSFSLPGSTAIFQWQIHPVEHGPLRYTLVAIDPGSSPRDGAAQSGEKVQAIYHHIGLGTSLSTMQHSEGILLLPPCRDGQESAQEGVIVASLLGLLWRVRGMGDRGRRTSEGGRRNSLFGKMLRKRSTG
ncbi:hypothetical protein CONLIGDRAFT_709987 [Coniochaeta ligniaria NRRL 30616]|uniref:Uncharacterized protein n=1 Tax=Coniochaeta ligniaria NRRL 30616 TaxID=1408157 RepID=A0A1J7K3F1_9PEZI|nr:hypothetical protein CONLIGDRAFT_709987 [Coniochaeta ligniaria NRRL 30616]